MTGTASTLLVKGPRGCHTQLTAWRSHAQRRSLREGICRIGVIGRLVCRCGVAESPSERRGRPVWTIRVTCYTGPLGWADSDAFTPHATAGVRAGLPGRGYRMDQHGTCTGLQGTRPAAPVPGLYSGSRRTRSPLRAGPRGTRTTAKTLRHRDAGYGPANPHPRGSFHRPIIGTDPRDRACATRPAGPGDPSEAWA